MNILTKQLPTKIKVNNNIYDINYDFRTVILTLQALEDPELTHFEKLNILVNNIYKDDIPYEDYEEACKQASKFIDLGKDNNGTNKKSNVRIFSFEKDANYIFTGINLTHNIDLEKEKNLHWWKFMAMFMDMSPECMFGELVYYKKRKAEGKLTKDEKKQYEKIKDLVDLEVVKVQSQSRKKFFEEYYKTQQKRGD